MGSTALETWVPLPWKPGHKVLEWRVSGGLETYVRLGNDKQPEHVLEGSTGASEGALDIYRKTFWTFVGKRSRHFWDERSGHF